LLFRKNPQRLTNLDAVPCALESLDDPVQHLKIVRPQLVHAATTQVIGVSKTITNIEEIRGGRAPRHATRLVPARRRMERPLPYKPACPLITSPDRVGKTEPFQLAAV
jgi:hypothetical protein